MTLHQLGLELRQLVLRQRLEARHLDARRLQAAIGDLCGSEYSELVGPLRYLVLSTPFASAAGQDPPLGDPRLLGRLQQELSQMYAAPLCQRLQPVLEGLLGLAPSTQPTTMGQATAAASSSPAGATGMTPPLTAMPPAAAAVASAAAAPFAVASAPPRSAGTSPLNVALAFISGMLLMALAGIGLWLLQRPPQPSGSGSPAARVAIERDRAPAGSAPPVPATTAASDGSPATGEGREEATGHSTTAVTEAEALDRALASVNTLYAALSAKDYERARSLFSAAAADQFEAAFFDQFAQVTVQDLRLISQSGSSVNLEGIVSFVYPDGTTQTETRTFSLDGSSEPPLITASAFGRVIKPR